MRPPPKLAERLAQIAKDIKALEKRTIANIIGIGKLLQEAADSCEHGQYAGWLDTEFRWSLQTALNYRNVYNFNKAIVDAYSEWMKIRKNSPSQKPNGLVFASVAELNLTQSALYLVAGMKRPEQQAARLAIIETAQTERVTYQRAKEIAQQVQDEEDGIDPPPEKGERTARTNPPILGKAEFDAEMSTIAVSIERADKIIGPLIGGLSENWVNGTAEEILGAIEGLRKLLERIRGNQRTIQGHFTVIESE